MLKFIIAILALTLPASAYAKYFEPYEATNTLRIPPGDILIEPKKHPLIFAIDEELVVIYPVAVGREGMAWSGEAEVGRMVEGPAWHPTEAQRKRKKLPVRVAPGPNNPLGSHALYLFDGGRDTLFRIHGTNAPASIGKSVSDGCIRMRNDHIEVLYEMVDIGANVIVR